MNAVIPPVVARKRRDEGNTELQRNYSAESRKGWGGEDTVCLMDHFEADILIPISILTDCPLPPPLGAS